MRKRRGAQRDGTDMPKDHPGRKDTDEPNAQVEHEADALDLPLYEPVGRLPSGHLVLADATGALVVTGSVASFLEDNSDEACPTCGLVHEVLDDDEATGGDDQQREGRAPTTGTPAAKPAGKAEPADLLLHTHRREPGGVPMHHAHADGDRPHQHKSITTIGYRPPKVPATPKTAAKATPAPKVPTQATAVRTAPATPATKGGRRRGPIVTTAWHAHRVASERERKDET